MAMAGVSNDVGGDGLTAGASVLTRPAEEFDNDPSVEALWAMKALEHAEVYFNGSKARLARKADGLTATSELMIVISDNPMGLHGLLQILCSVDPKLLKLTPHDDNIYKTFREEFPDLKVDILDEEGLKSFEAKQKWRPFCEKFKDVVEDYSFGTLLRLDHSGEYSEHNSILVTRIQFYAVELSRNREGLNDCIRSKFKPRKSSKNQ